MQAKFSLLFIILLLSSLLLNAQSYAKRYDKCSEPLRSLGVVDSLYFVRAVERDSCLRGAIAPDFKVSTVTGEIIELSKLKGQVVVLNFWFTRCQPCIEEMPELNRLVDLYSGKKVRFISFAPEDEPTLQNFFQQHPFKFSAVAKAEGIRREKFKLFSVWPYAIIIDQQGKINKMWFGNIGEGIFEYYQKTIDKLLEG
jgi:peroxiredoxin